MYNIEKSKNLVKILGPVLFVIFVMLLVVFSPGKISWVADAFGPVIYAFVLAYLLDSVVKFCVNKLHVRRSQGIFIACIALIGIIMLLFSIIVPKIVENINAIISFFLEGNFDIEEIVANIRMRTDNKYILMGADMILEAGEAIKDRLNAILLYLSNTVLQLVTGVGSKALGIFTSFIICIYMLIEKDDLIARLKRFIYAFFEESKAKKITEAGSEANIIFKSFLNGKILDSFIVGVVVTICFTIFRVPYAPLMGSLIGVFNMIPYFGPIVGTVPVVVVCFFVDPSKVIVAIAIIIIVGQIDANYIDPKIVGNNVGVSPFWVLTAVTVGGAAAGPAGMVFGVPCLVLIKSLIEECIEMRLVEKGIGELERENLKDIETKHKKKKVKRSLQ